MQSYLYEILDRNDLETDLNRLFEEDWRYYNVNHILAKKNVNCPKECYKLLFLGTIGRDFDV